jgi:hypothetical protein
MPEKGIVIADRDTLGNKYPYLGEVMLICAKSDKEFHPSAHLHVVHNPIDCQNKRNSLWNPYHIPHWPQPGLIPRSRDRASLVENIAYLGTRSNLAKEFNTDKWKQALTDLGCNWLPIFSPSSWNDYSNIDVVVAVRSFEDGSYLNKPASKLINCWQASVPAILGGSESAFASIRKSELDFLSVSSIDEAINMVSKLKKNPKLYMLMIENGQKRFQDFNESKVTYNWIEFFEKSAFPEYSRWLKLSEFHRLRLFTMRYFKLKQSRMTNRILNKFSR